MSRAFRSSRLRISIAQLGEVGEVAHRPGEVVVGLRQDLLAELPQLDLEVGRLAGERLLAVVGREGDVEALRVADVQPDELVLEARDQAILADDQRHPLGGSVASKEDLIDAMGKRERRRFTAAYDAMSGVVGVARLEAAVDVVARFVEIQPPGRLLDLEPSFAYDQMTAALPMLVEGLVAVLTRCACEGRCPTRWIPATLARAIARTALSHYIFPSPTAPRLVKQIRAAAGLSGRASRTM